MNWSCVIVSCVFALIVGCQSQPRNSDGVAYFGQAKYDKALLAFESAAATDANAAYNMGATYYYLGKNSASLGKTDLAQQQLAAAEAAYKRCLATDPNHVAANRGLAVLWSETGHPQQAFDLLMDWNRRATSSTDAKVELSRLYQEHGHANESQMLLQSVLAYDPNNARALRAVGYFYDAAGQTAQAAENYRRSIVSSPQQRDLEERLRVLQAGLAAPITPAQSTQYAQGPATIYPVR
ncbi:MAG: tetratricopeptide repeat protein [Thermoguttaceae bacterium]